MNNLHHPPGSGNLAEIAARGVAAVALSRGARLIGRNHLSPCPACGEERRSRSEDRLGPVFLTAGGQGWACQRCGERGDAVVWLCWSVCGSRLPPGDPRWAAVLEAVGGREIPPVELPPPPEPPPLAEVEALLEACVPGSWSPEVRGWIARRLGAGVDAEALDACVLALEDRRLPAWAAAGKSRDKRWYQAGYRAILPVYDASGRLRSVRARWTGEGQAPRPKGSPPVGYGLGGLVLADGAGVRALRDADARRVVIAEGEPAFLAWASWAAGQEDPPAVWGIVAGSWSPLIAERIPRGAEVLIATDADRAGDGYAETIQATLPGRRILRWRSEVQADELVRDGGALSWGALPEAESPSPGRPEIRLGPDLHRVNDEATVALATDAAVYERGGQLVAVVPDTDLGRLGWRPLDAPAVQDRLSRAASVVRWARSTEEWVEVAVPLDLARQVLSRGHWPPTRLLAGIATEPTLRADGSILQGRPGYDPASRLLYAPTEEFAPVPDRPTRAQTEAAAAALLEVIQDFPFQSAGARSAWIAAVLTPLARHAFSGPAPLFLIEANIRGAGKTKAAQAAGLIATGRVPGAAPPPSDDDEMRKKITAIALKDQRIALIDNVAGPIGWPSLDAVLTSNVHEDRLLGGNQQIEREMRATWYMTANNARYSADLIRRTLPMRIESPLDRPEDRGAGELAHPDLLGWVAGERARLAVAALTLLRAHAVAGFPTAGLAAWGSFEAWSRIVRGAVVGAGLPDPILARADIDEQDEAAGLLTRLLAVLLRLYPRGERFRASDLLRLTQLDGHPTTPYGVLRADADELREVCVTLAGDLRGAVSSRGLGRRLGGLRGQRSGGLFLASRVEKGVATFWVQGQDPEEG